MRSGTAVLAALLLAACGGPDTPAPDDPADDTPATVSVADPAAAQSVAAAYDPARQRFIWVLPPGIHGKGPWEFKATVKHKGEVKFETALPMKPELLTPGSRPEYPAGHEIIRLASDGDWAKTTAEIDRVVSDLIARHGRGDGEVVMQNDLKVTVDPAYRQTYCVDGASPEIHAYVEDDSAAAPVRLDVAAMAPMFRAVVMEACAS